MVSLPANLTGTYRDYKDDTTTFATWLGNTAEECGYQLPRVENAQQRAPTPASRGRGGRRAPQVRAAAPVLHESPRARGRRGGRAGGASRPPTLPHLRDDSEPEPNTVAVAVAVTKIPVREIIVQAESIARSEKKVSLTIQRILRQAIAARKRCSRWYEKSKVPSQDQAEFDRKNAAHKYFIEVLERTRDILEPFFVKLKIRKQTAKATTVSSLGNRFAGLVVEDFEDDELDTVEEDIEMAQYRPSEIGKGKGKKKSGKVFEFDVDDDAELPLIVLGFFNDVQQMLAFIKETWDMYMDPASPVDLLSASLLTSLGIELIETTENELLAKYPEHILKEMPYNTMRKLLFETQKSKFAAIPGVIVSEGVELAPDSNETTREMIKIAGMEFETLALLPTYMTLYKYMSFSSGIGDVYPWQRTMRAEALDSVLPEGMIPLDPEWKKNNDVVLTQMLLDVRWRPTRTFPEDGMTDRERKDRNFWPTEEPITKAMIKCREDTEIGLWQVFACQVAVDIYEILGDTVAEPYIRLRKQAATIWRRLGFRLPQDEKEGPWGLYDDDSEYFGENDPWEEAKGLSFWIRENIQRDPLVCFKSGFMDKYPGLWPETHSMTAEDFAASLVANIRSNYVASEKDSEEEFELAPGVTRITWPAPVEANYTTAPVEEEPCQPQSSYRVPIVEDAEEGEEEEDFSRVDHDDSELDIDFSVNHTLLYSGTSNYRSPTIEDVKEEEDAFRVHYDDSELDMDFAVNHTLLRPRKSNYMPPSVEDDDPYQQPPETAKNYVLPSPDPAYYYNSQPVHSGIQSLKLSVAFEKMSLEVFNSHTSFLAFSNLYNAVRQTKLLDEEWEFFEKAVELYKDQLFVGKVLPSTPSEILQRYMLRLGYPLATFSDARVSRKFPNAVKATKKIFKPTPTSEHIKKYLDGDVTARDLLRNLPNQAEYSTIPTHQDMLAKLRDWLPATMATIQTDWTTLSRVSTDAMWHVGQEVTKDLKVPEAPPIEHYRIFPIGCRFLTLFILDNAFLAELQAEDLASRKNRQGPNGKLLRIMEGSVIAKAANTIGKFAKNWASEVVEEIKPFEIVLPGSEPATSSFQFMTSLAEQDEVRERRRNGTYGTGFVTG